MNWREYIHSDASVLAGKPVVRGTRLAADFLLGLFAAGWTRAEVLDSYPQLSDEALNAVFAVAAEAMREESFYAAAMNRKPDADELREEYDLSVEDVRGGIRGKYATSYAQGADLPSIRQRSELTEPDAAALADEVDRAVWERVRHRVDDGEGSRT